MGIFKETIATLTLSSTTQVTLVGRSVVKLGGLYKVLNSPSLSTATTGIGGLDTGAVAASTLYYVYAVSDGTTEGIVASTSSTSPSGFTRYKKVGAFYTNSSNAVSSIYQQLANVSFEQSEKIDISTDVTTSTNLASGTHTDVIGSGLYSLSSSGITILKKCRMTALIRTTDPTGPDYARTFIYLNGSTIVFNDNYRDGSGGRAGTSILSIKLKVNDIITFAGSSGSGGTTNFILIQAISEDNSVFDWKDY